MNNAKWIIFCVDKHKGNPQSMKMVHLPICMPIYKRRFLKQSLWRH